MKCIVTLLLCLVYLSAAAANSDETIMVDGRVRRYLVHDFATGSDLAPLVILLHGGGGSGQNMVEQTGFDAVAARDGLIAVYPYGSNGVFDNVLLTWNAAHCCAYAMRDNVDDVHFLSLLIDHLIAPRKVDPGRVYVTGLSNGGMMTHRVGIELADKVAGIAPVIAGIFGDEPVRDYAMPVLIINGAEDQRVKAAGGELQGFGLGISPADLPTLPIAAQGEYWARVNVCKSVVDSANATYDHRVYGDCRAGGRLESYVVKGNGHAWPGGRAPRGEADTPVQTFNASEVIWNFFKPLRRDQAPAGTTVAYYYDQQLNIPVFGTNDRQYSAQLLLLPRIPMEFELLRLQTRAVTVMNNDNIYRAGTLTLQAVTVGGSQRAATLQVIEATPLRLRLMP